MNIWGTVADWAAVAIAICSLVIAGMALYSSHKLDKMNSKLLQRQVNPEFVRWHVMRDVETYDYIFTNIGSDTAHNIIAHASIQGTNGLAVTTHEQCESGNSFRMDATKFFGQDGKVTNYYTAKHFARNDEINPITVHILVEWRDTLGFSYQQEILIRYA